MKKNFINKNNMWYFIIFGIAVILLNIYIWVIYKKTDIENYDNNREIDKIQAGLQKRINDFGRRKTDTINKQNELTKNFSKEQMLAYLKNLANNYSIWIENLKRDKEYWEKQRFRRSNNKKSKKQNEPIIMNLDKCKDEFFITTRNEIQNTLLKPEDDEIKIRILNEIKNKQPYASCLYGNNTFKGLLDILSEDAETPEEYSDQIRQIKDWNYNNFTLNSASILREVKSFNPINTTKESRDTLNILKNRETSGKKIKSLVDNNNIR